MRFIVTCPSKPDCGQQIDMVAGKWWQDSAISTPKLQQKFDRLVSLEMTDQLIPHFSNTMQYIITANLQRLDHKQQS